MMSGYTKLFASILESTIWLETPPIKVVWITLLAMADRDGIVEASIPGLAKRAGVERTQCEQALAVFLAPDPDSRTITNEGRRITVVSGGWRLLNYEIYRQRASKEDAAEKNADRQRRFREAKALRAVTNVTSVISNDIAPSPSPSPSPENKILSSADADFEAFRAAYPTSRRVGGKAAKSAFMRALKVCDVEFMLVALTQHKQSEQWQTPKLIPLMTTWLNQERWTQTLPSPARISSAGQTTRAAGERVMALLRGTHDS